MALAEYEKRRPIGQKVGYNLVAGLPGVVCSWIPNFQQLDAKIKSWIPNFLKFIFATRNKLSITVLFTYSYKPEKESIGLWSQIMVYKSTDNNQKNTPHARNYAKIQKSTNQNRSIYSRHTTPRIKKTHHQSIYIH